MRIEVFNPGLLEKSVCPVEMNLISINDFPYHWHNDLEILIILKGRVTLFTGASYAGLKAGDIEIININEIHRIIGEKGNIVLSLKINHESAEEIIPEISKRPGDCLTPIKLWSSSIIRIMFPASAVS